MLNTTMNVFTPLRISYYLNSAGFRNYNKSIMGYRTSICFFSDLYLFILLFSINFVTFLFSVYIIRNSFVPRKG